MNDELDKMTDAELNEAFAVEVAGLHFDPPLARWYDASDCPVTFGNDECAPNYCGDTNSVLTWLEKQQYWSGKRPNMPYEVIIYTNPDDFKTFFIGNGQTFGNASCKAMLRAKRAAK
jgi:hypothetical protein